MRSARSLLKVIVDRCHEIGMYSKKHDAMSPYGLLLDLTIMAIVFIGLAMTIVIANPEGLSGGVGIVLTTCFGILGLTILVVLIALLIRTLKR